MFHPLTLPHVVENQVQIRNKTNEEKDKKKTKDTFMHISEIKCSKFQSRKHKSNDCPNKIVIMQKKIVKSQNRSFFIHPLRKNKGKTIINLALQKEVTPKLHGFNTR